MAFHDVSLPDGFDYGSASGPGFATLILPTASGHEVRVARQSQARHRFLPVKGLESTAEAYAVKTFGLARRGSLHSWPLRDLLDHTSAVDGQATPTGLDQVLGTCTGGADTFSLLKLYEGAGPSPYVRTIQLPVAGSLIVMIDGAPTESYTEANGRITLTGTLGQIVTAGFRFVVPVRFDANVDAWAKMNVDAYEAWSAESLACTEVLDEVEWPELWTPGGDRDWGQRSQSIAIAAKDGQLHLVEATAAISLFLPPPDEWPGGDRIFTLHNKPAATHTVQVRDDSGAAVGAAISPGSTKRVLLSVSGGTATWGLY